MKILKALAILLFGPLLGLFAAFFLGAVTLPPDPNFVANGGHAAPGDGFVILPFVLVSLLISIPSSVFLAGAVLFRSPKPRNDAWGQHSNGGRK